MKYGSCIFIFVLATACLQAQPSTKNFDSLAINKPKKGKPHYELAVPPFSEIELKWKRPKRSPHTAGQMAGDATRNILTSILGGSITTSQDLDWQLTSELNTGIDSLDWRVDLFCTGELEKESHRVRNEDGSHSLEKEKTAHLFWDKGTSGILIEKNDTLGRFTIAINNWEDSSLTDEARAIFEERDSRPSDPWSPAFHGAHYGLKGDFRGQQLLVYYNGDVNKGWMYVGGKLVGMFQSDNEPPGAASIVYLGKKYKAPPRLAPYLLYDNSISFADCLRMGMLSRMIAYAVSQNNWDY